MRIVNGIDELRGLVVETLDTSSWHEVTQDKIRAFTDATEDWNPLHVNPERAAKAPWGSRSPTVSTHSPWARG